MTHGLNRHGRRVTVVAGVLATVCGVALAGVSGAQASTAGTSGSTSSSRACSPRVTAVGFSDSLNKLQYQGATVGGLSSIAYDRRSAAWISAVDNNATDPSRIWFYRNLSDPTVARTPLVLKKPDGTPYDGTTADNEGLAVLPDGNYLVSSETEPSIRIFDRSGVQKQELPVPARFAVTGTTAAGEATSNATLEGLTITPDGRRVVAAMEGALRGDVSASGDATLHRFLIYDADRRGTWHLTKQVAYRADTGMRIPEVAAYTNDSLLVEEASFSTATGNAVDLFAVQGLDRAKDVSSVSNLSTAPAKVVVGKQPIADLVNCPTLGAPSKETQTNPLLDNFEGMAITSSPTFTRPAYGVALISDDNFSATQTTRILRLSARLP
jgi:hypothetical protein